jgi:hypothetical protein
MAKKTLLDSGNSELIKCRGSIRAIEGSIIIFLIATILIIIGYSEYTKECKGNDSNCPDETKDKLIAGGCLYFIAFIVLIIATINAAFYGCFRTAIMGTLLSVLII